MYSLRSRYNLAAILFLCTFLAWAQSEAVPIELEGPISAIIDNGDGSGSITVMGITVEIPVTATINSPTRSLTLAQLADPTSLPGRTELGFIGGTAIILGESDGITNTADDIFVEPAENVVLGLITAANCTNRLCTNNSIQALGTPTRRLTGANTQGRMPANHPINELGFQIDLGLTQANGGLIDAPVAIEGYFDGTRLNWFVLELAGIGQLRRPAQAEISVLRAQCRERGNRGIELDVMGSVHRAGNAGPPQTFPDPEVAPNGATSVRIRATAAEGGAIFGDTGVVAVLDEVTGLPTGFGEYDFALGDNPGFTVCPNRVRAAFRIPGEPNASVTADVDVRL